MIYRLVSLLPCLLLSLSALHAQDAGPAYVDQAGVLRWSGTDEEIYGFGVNYTVPFAHAYRSAVRLGVDPLRAIDQDVYHFARMGFDLYRVHVWDTQISDTLGNLTFNEHLNAFDYLIAELGKRDVNYVLTPIAYWGDGWPEPDGETPGFSHRYGKAGSLTEEAAIRAQENYLRQFMEHVNPYTGTAYRDDPRLIAVEVSNEPHHRGTPAEVTRFVGRMVAALRGSGTEKPILYNITHAVQRVPDYFAGGIDGGTFQWYPAGLTYQRALPVNALPYVDRYVIPFDSVVRAGGGAKVVYEFDPADIDQAYPYPAMARAFRAAGMQLATQFAYDPTFLAPFNTEYNTHYMNLAYTPRKAIGLMIAGEVFHRVPRYADYGAYPADTTFGDFTVSYPRELALLNAADKYYYSNSTDEAPRASDSLRHVAGYGNSPVVRYDGAGAYFLDRLRDGVWRLEVMPDALRVGNAYGRNSPRKPVTVLQHNTRTMRVSLDDLGRDFSLLPLGEGGTATRVADDAFEVRPGTYLLTARPGDPAIGPGTRVGTLGVAEYGGPAGTVDRTYLVHDAPRTATAGKELHLSVQATMPDGPPAVVTLVPTEGAPLPFTPGDGFTYSLTVPAERLSAGHFDYYITVGLGDETRTFPADAPGRPFDWDVYDRQAYRTTILPGGAPVRLLDAATDRDSLVLSRWLPDLELLPRGAGGGAEFRVPLTELAVTDPENTDAEPEFDYTIHHFLRGRMPATPEGYRELVINARWLGDGKLPVQVGLVLDDGSTYAGSVTLSSRLEEHSLSLDDLRLVPTVTMPRPYPSFLPYYFESADPVPFDLRRVQAVQVRIGPGLNARQRAAPGGIGLTHIDLR